jgi:hypothetical protein
MNRWLKEGSGNKEGFQSDLAGWLCPALKHAVKSMKMEEVVILTVLPQCIVNEPILPGNELYFFGYLALKVSI